MKLNNNTILITGGSSGIGLELAKQLHKKKNKIIICGRSLKKLEQAQKLIPDIITFQCDLSLKPQRLALKDYIERYFPGCNMVIHNAAVVHKASFFDDDNIIEAIELEIQTNLLAPIEMSKLLLPLLEKNTSPTMMYMTSGLAYQPKAAYPFYSASKAALHSFIQTTKHNAQNRPLNLIEVVLPVVDTPFHNGDTPSSAISAHTAVKEIIKQTENGKKEIRVGLIKVFYQLSRFFPKFAFRKVNGL